MEHRGGNFSMANQPKKYKKFVATAATATLVASAIVPVASAAENNFTDISNYSADVQEAINALVEEGVINATSDTFNPGAAITRGQVVKMLGKLVEQGGFELPEDWNTEARFTDLAVNAKDQELVKYAAIVADAGVFTGNNGVLNASGKITRENMALVLNRAYEAITGTSLVELADGIENQEVADLATAKAEAQDTIQALKNLGITTPANFNPKGDVTRANFAAFLYRAITVEVTEELTVKSVTVTNATTLEVKLSDDTTHTVTLANALEANKATEVTFTIGGVEYTETVTYVEKALAVETVSAVNGTVTVVLSKTPETTPVAADFAITRTINGAGEITVQPTGFSYDVATKTAKFTVGQVPATGAAQTVAYSVAYKTTDAKSGSFTVAADTAGALKYIGSDDTTETITLFFDKPVNGTIAQNVGNYVWDNNRNSAANTPVFPTAVALNSTPVGAYGVNQVVTLTFGALVAGEQGALTVQNLKDANGLVIPTSTNNVDIVASDAALTSITPSLTAGSQQNRATVTVNTGDVVTLNALTTDALNGIVSLRYRLVAPDGSVTAWTNLNVADGKLGDKAETGTAQITLPAGTSGTYTVAVEAVDADGNTSTNTTTSIVVNGGDITAPTTTATTAQYNVAPTGTAAERTVSVTASVVDTQSKVTGTQYRVQAFNASTGAFETVVDWKNVTNTVDGAFDELVEEVSFTTEQLAPNKDYRIQVRSKDAANNTANPASITVVGAGAAAAAATTADAAAFNVPAAESTIPTIALGATPYAPADASLVRTTAFSITGTANDNAGVAKVEYSIYKDNDANGTYETLVVPFNAAGVQVTDGQWGGTAEPYTINANLPSVDGRYRIVTRVTDTSGNVSDTSIAADAQYNLVLDTTAPTVLGFTENQATLLKNDVIVTFNEGMNVGGGVFAPTDAATSASIFDADNYVVFRNGVQVTNAVSNIVTVTTGTTNQYLVTFTNELLAGDEVRLVEVTDLVGNKLAPNPTKYTFQAK